MYKWLLDCIIYCFADPVDNRESSSSDSSEDCYGSISEYAHDRYGIDLENSELSKGVTIEQSAPPNYGYNSSHQKPTKIFEDEAIIIDDTKVAVQAHKISIWYIIFPYDLEN